MYGVVILNYNVGKDAINAAKSVVNTAENQNYHIVIVDNCSTKHGEHDLLINLCRDVCNCDLLFLSSNNGYADGNNQGMLYLREKYPIDYFVIMNPDVEISVEGTIDRLIGAVVGTSYCGVQPIVWTKTNKLQKEYQTSVRRVYKYVDCLIESNFLTKRLFYKSARNQVFFNRRPYSESFAFEVPSGAFFIMKSDIFSKIGFFDAGTFLYAEEIILGLKLYKENQQFLFVPTEFVIHEGGKSIGATSKMITRFSFGCELRSYCYYLEKYLNCNSLQLSLFKILKYFDYYIKKIKFKYENF